MIIRDSPKVKMKTIQQLCNFLQSEIENKNVLAHINECAKKATSTAGSRSMEEIFTREFICKSLLKFFNTEIREQLNLTDEQITKGMGTEGFKNVDGFGFTPARQKKHFFTKGQVIASEPPDAWFKDSDKKLTSYMACPDFAIRAPLPISTVGETKYFTKGSQKAAIKELYNGIRQAMFYLGAFNEYKDALLIVADASPDHTFASSLDLLEDDLLSRFGEETNIHLCVIKLS